MIDVIDVIDGVDSSFFFGGSLRLLVCFRAFIFFIRSPSSSILHPSFLRFTLFEGDKEVSRPLTYRPASLPYLFAFFSAERGGGVDDILLTFFISLPSLLSPCHFTYPALPYFLPFFPGVRSWGL